MLAVGTSLLAPAPAKAQANDANVPAAVASLFDDQARTPSQSRRNRDFDAMQVLVHDDVPVIPLYYEDRLIGVGDRVVGYRINMLWIPVNAENWDVTTE